MIAMSRALLLGLAALFSAYHIVLGLYSLGQSQSQGQMLAAMGLYGVATLISLWPTSSIKMPVWMGLFNLAVCTVLPLLVASGLDGSSDNGYATWYVAAVGTLMTITATRKRPLEALLGVAFLLVHTIVWAGPGALGSFGSIGSAVWVATAVLLSRALTKAARDARAFARAEREATKWQAAQDAHVYERSVRLALTNRLSAPMLRRIVERRGDLDASQRRECRTLEAAIRDEIRGRKLLNDAVRERVMAARRRGAIVTILDEGGIDDLDEEQLDRVLSRLAEAIGQTTADTIIARTAADGSATAVTLVGLSSSDPSETALGQDTEDEVDLWLEIPREAPVAVES